MHSIDLPSACVKAGKCGPALPSRLPAPRRIDFTQGPTSTTATDFASIQALAQTLLSGTVSYAFVADGADGFLFTTGGSGTAIQDAVKLAGAGTATSFKYQDIGHTITA